MGRPGREVRAVAAGEKVNPHEGGLPLLINLLNRLSGVVNIVITADAFWFERMDGSGRTIALPATATIPPPDMPPQRLPPAVRDGLTTRRHLRKEPIEQPVIVRGEIALGAQSEALIKQGFEQTQRRLLQRLIKPTTIVTAPGLHYPIRKRTVIEMVERAGARRIFLVENTMAAAIGAEVDIVNAQAAGVLIIDRDCAEFAVIGFADHLCRCYIPFGIDDLDGPNDPLLEKMTAAIADALTDLREPQYETLALEGIVLLGRGVQTPWLPDALSEQFGIAVRPVVTDPHPALIGLRVYVDHLEQWRMTMEADRDQT